MAVRILSGGGACSKASRRSPQARIPRTFVAAFCRKSAEFEHPCRLRLHIYKRNPLVAILGLLEAGLLTHFLLQYVLRGLPLRLRLVDLVKQIESVDPQSPETIKSSLDKVFRGTRLARVWREFEATLHEQHSPVGAERRVSAIRATQPAEAFFNLETVADPWIGSEYFKHLPGILTGFGIIGTFLGLIQGLIHFDPGLTDSADRAAIELLHTQGKGGIRPDASPAYRSDAAGKLRATMILLAEHQFSVM